MALSTTTDLNGLYNDILEGARHVARARNLMTAMVTTMGAKGWMTRKVGIWSTTSAVTVAEDEDVANATKLTKTLDAELVPGEIAAQYILTDRMMETDPDGALAAAKFELGAAVAEKMDTDLSTAMASFTKEKGASGASLTLAKCAAALAYLQTAKVPGPYVFILHPYGWFDIWTELGQPAVNQAFLGDLANQALRQYFVSNMLNSLWFVSPNIPVDSTPDAVSGVFNKQALAIDMRRAPRLGMQRDESARATELTITAGYGYGVWRANFGVKMTHDATEP